MRILKKLGIVLAVFFAAVLVTSVFVYFDDEELEETVLPEHTGVFFVEDYSGVLNNLTETVIYDNAEALEAATKAQVCVVTVPNTQADSLEEFSRKLANAWGIGDAKLDNGILLLFVTDPDDPHVRLEVGKGLEGAIPDGKAGRILDDYAVPARDAGEWNRAAGDTFVNVVEALYDEYGLEYPEILRTYDWESEEEAENYSEGILDITDPEFPEMKVTKNTAPFIERVADAFIEGLAIIVVLVVFFGFVGLLLWILSLFEAYGGRSGYGGRGGFGGGGGFGGHSGGGGSFGGGGASR